MELKLTYSENQNDIDSYKINPVSNILNQHVVEIKGWMYEKHRCIDGVCEEDIIEEGTFYAYKRFLVHKAIPITEELLEKFGYICGVEWFPGSGYGTGLYSFGDVCVMDDYLTLYIQTDEMNRVTHEDSKKKYCYSFDCKIYVDGEEYTVE